MSNAHIKNAAGYIEVAQAVSRHTSGNPPTADLCALAQAEALLAVAYELRTANLLKAYGGITPRSENGLAAIKERL